MIRGYKAEDKNIIIDILNKGLILDMSYINNDFSNKNNIISVYEDGKVKGFGKKTTAFAIDKALEKGVKRINLDVVMWNVRARHVYEQFGFKINQGIVSWRK